MPGYELVSTRHRTSNSPQETPTEKDVSMGIAIYDDLLSRNKGNILSLTCYEAGIRKKNFRIHQFYNYSNVHSYVHYYKQVRERQDSCKMISIKSTCHDVIYVFCMIYNLQCHV